MRIELYGIAFDTPGVVFYLWSPWRCTAIEHRLFEAVKALDPEQLETTPEEVRWSMNDVRHWPKILQHCERILKGWQEEGSDAGTERRIWRWLLESDTDSDGYDHTGEKAGMWAFIRLTLDRAHMGEAEKSEDIDLNGFGLRIRNTADT
jgi:hypothetical protein